MGFGGCTVRRDKSVFVLVHCWVSGAALVVPVGPSCRLVTWLWLVVCGVVLCENCIVDASIKHTGWIAFLWFVCVCLCDFFFL